MPDRVRIKVCGLTSTEAIGSAIDAGVDAVGVVLSPSPRQVSPDEAAELLKGVSGYVAAVAVYKHPDADLAEHARRVLPPWVLHQSDATDFTGVLSAVPGDRRVPVVRAIDGFEDSMHGHKDRLVLVEGANSGTGQPADWYRAASWISRAHVIIAGGLHAGNVGRVVRELRPFAVDVSSGVESSPGVKDPAKIRAFIAAVREAEAS